MRDVDSTAISAKENKQLLNAFISQQKGFIYDSAYKVIGRYITDQSDEASIAMVAFTEAVSSYDYDKGSFYHFATQVINRRLIDYMRSEYRHKREISINPSVFDGELDDETEISNDHNQIIKQMYIMPDDSLKYEIESITNQLKFYNISFFDIAKCSPKAIKTKVSCAKAAACIIEDINLLKEMRTTKQLPLKILENNLGIPRKIFESHRKYIITAIEIITGDYPHLAEYMSLIKKELCK